MRSGGHLTEGHAMTYTPVRDPSSPGRWLVVYPLPGGGPCEFGVASSHLTERSAREEAAVLTQAAASAHARIRAACKVLRLRAWLQRAANEPATPPPLQRA